MATLLVLTDFGQAGKLIPWALRFANSRSSTLMILCLLTGDLTQPMMIASPEHLRYSEGLLNDVRVAKQRYDPSDTAQLWFMQTPDPAVSLLQEIQSRSQIDLVILPARQELTDDISSDLDISSHIFRHAPVDTVVMDPGQGEPEPQGRIVVPVDGPLIQFTLQAASKLTTRDGTVVPLMIGPQFGVDSRAIARKELDTRLKEHTSGLDISKFSPEVFVADRVLEGIARAATSSNLILVGSNSDQVLYRIRNEITSGKDGAKTRCALAVIRSAKTPQKGIKGNILNPLTGWIPKLDPTERVRLFDRLYGGVQLSKDFLVMMTLSTAIATIGLLQDASAVVIGAMLVAPLMTPLIGAGFALVQGNIRLFAHAIKAMGFGVCSGLLISWGMGLLAPQDDLPLEVLKRASPDLLDFLVAYLSGMAAAYAFSRPGLLGIIAGVAIAAALVPPLASVGIGLSNGELIVVEGAGILHLVNLVAIIMGSATVFHLLGIQGTRLGIGRALWVRRSLLLIILSAAFLLVPLGYKTSEKILKGQARPLAFPLSASLDEALLKRVEREDIDLIMASRSGFIENRNDIFILLAAKGSVSSELKRDLRQIIMTQLGGDVHVKIWVLSSAETN